MLFTEADVTEIDLTAGNRDTSFAIVNENSNQRTLLVIRNSTEDFSFSVLKHNSTITERNITLNLIDSSTGTMVCIMITERLCTLYCFYRSMKLMLQPS